MLLRTSLFIFGAEMACVAVIYIGAFKRTEENEELGEKIKKDIYLSVPGGIYFPFHAFP
jgi:hypothetical protein